MLFVAAKDGTLLAIDASNGDTVWSQSTSQLSNRVDAAPVVDPNRQYVYGHGADGKIHKYAVTDGTEFIDAAWPAISSLKAEHATGALEIATANNGRTYLYAVTTGYYGDGGDYQGHVTAIELSTGAWQVFNAACSHVPGHMIENGTNGVNDCATTRNGIWGRSGAVYDQRTDKVYAATGNGPVDLSEPASTGVIAYLHSILMDPAPVAAFRSTVTRRPTMPISNTPIPIWVRARSYCFPHRSPTKRGQVHLSRSTISLTFFSWAIP